MRRSTFKRPKMVLIFNGAQVLVAVTRSLHSAAELTKGNLRAISFCCTGKYVCSGGLYFRHLHPDVEIELADPRHTDAEKIMTPFAARNARTIRCARWHKRALFEKQT